MPLNCILIMIAPIGNSNGIYSVLPTLFIYTDFISMHFWGCVGSYVSGGMCRVTCVGSNVPDHISRMTYVWSQVSGAKMEEILDRRRFNFFCSTLYCMN